MKIKVKFLWNYRILFCMKKQISGKSFHYDLFIIENLILRVEKFWLLLFSFHLNRSFFRFSHLPSDFIFHFSLLSFFVLLFPTWEIFHHHKNEQKLCSCLFSFLPRIWWWGSSKWRWRRRSRMNENGKAHLSKCRKQTHILLAPSSPNPHFVNTSDEVKRIILVRTCIQGW